MSKQSDLISILMPVYNVEKYIEQAIISILNQTYKNFELIIVDDYSKDRTYEIADKFACKDNRIKLFKNKENLKISKTLNFALEQAKGKYIARMDGDDISDISRIEKFYTFLTNNPDIYLVGCNVITINEEGSVIGRTECLSDWKKIGQTLKFRTPVLHVWMTYKTVYEKMGGYRDISGVEDYDFLLRMTAAGYKYTNLDEYLYYIRIQTHNTAFTIGPGQRKLHVYAFKLYKERIRTGTDSYNEDNYRKILQVNKLFMYLHNMSSRNLLKAITFKSKKKYISMIICIFFSCISPYQVSYLISGMKYKMIAGKRRKFEKEAA